MYSVPYNLFLFKDFLNIGFRLYKNILLHSIYLFYMCTRDVNDSVT